MPDAPMAPRAALCDLIADRVRERVLSGEWRVGQALDEGSLATDYGVSRTPVREALKLLQHEGLLQGYLRRGVVVASVDAKAVEEAACLRSLLLTHVAATGSAAPSPLLSRMLSLAEQRMRLGRVLQSGQAGHSVDVSSSP